MSTVLYLFECLLSLPLYSKYTEKEIGMLKQFGFHWNHIQNDHILHSLYHTTS